MPPLAVLKRTVTSTDLQHHHMPAHQGNVAGACMRTAGRHRSGGCARAAPPGIGRSRPPLRRRGLPRSRESMRLAALDRNWVIHAPQMPPYGTHHTKARPCLHPTLPYTLS